MVIHLPVSRLPSSCLIALPRVDEGEHDRLRVSSSRARSHTFPDLRATEHRAGLAASIAPDPVDGLYTTNASAPLLEQAGLRNYYNFGLYTYCAYVNGSAGTCSPHDTAKRLQPFMAILGDMPANYSRLTLALLPSDTFTVSQYLGEFSNGAYYLLLLGTIVAGLTLFVCVYIFQLFLYFS